MLKKNRILIIVLVLSLIYCSILYLISQVEFSISSRFYSLKAIENHQEVLSLIVGALASLSGVVIAVLIISYEINKDKLGRNAQSYYFGNKNLYLLSSLFIITISTSFASKFLIDESGVGIGLYYLSCILFFISLIIIIPISLKILFSFNIFEIVKLEANKITLNQLLDHSRIPTYYTNRNVEIFKQQLPVNLLKEIALKNIEIDTTITKIISRELLVKVTEIVDETMKQRSSLEFQELVPNQNDFFLEKIYLYTPYVEVLRVISRKAFNNQDENVIEAISYDLYFLLLHSAKSKVEPKECEVVFDFLETFYLELIDKKYNGIYLTSIIQFNNVLLKFFNTNCPKEHELSQIANIFKRKKPKHKNVKSDLHWLKLSQDYVHKYNKFLRACIDSKNVVAFNNTCSLVASFIYEIDKSKKLGSYQKQLISVKLHYNICSHIELAYELKLDETKLNFSNNIPMGHFVNDAIRNELRYVDFYLSQIGQYIMKLSRLTKVGYFELTELNTLISLCLRREHHSINSDKGFQYLLKVLEFLKHEFEKDLKFNRDGYKYLIEQTNFLLKWSLKSPNKSLNKQIKVIKDSFKSIDESDEDMIHKVKWK